MMLEVTEDMATSWTDHPLISPTLATALQKGGKYRKSTFSETKLQFKGSKTF
jgi:hypothetical protein